MTPPQTLKMLNGTISILDGPLLRAMCALLGIALGPSYSSSGPVYKQFITVSSFYVTPLRVSIGLLLNILDTHARRCRDDVEC